MYDMHYDLLTILYFNLTKQNPLSNIPKLLKNCKKIYQHNVLGGIINLYFMSPEEMLEELGITEEELHNVEKMFKKSITYLEQLKKEKIIPYDIEFLYSIEGCDYLKNENDLEILYNLGLRAILPVWNEKNKFGSGNRSEEGLTELGKRLIKKAMNLGIIVDVSHANQKTFYNILEVVEEQMKYNKDAIVMATHSNVKSICHKERNLDDQQLKRLKELRCYIGLFTNSKFLSDNYQELDYKERQEVFLKHLNYIIYQIKFPIDKIIVSTDDMNFHPDPKYHRTEAFKIETIAIDMYELIKKNLSEEIAEAILIKNPQTIIKKVK